MSLLYKNFRGRNESLSANVSLGYNPGYSLLYYNPYIDRKRNISFSGGTSYLSSNNISTLAELEYGKDFKYRIISGWLQLGKRLNLFNDVYLLLGYDYVEAPDSSSGRITASGNRIDNTFKIGLTYSFDTRNLKQFPDSGIYAGIDYSQKGLGIDKINIATADGAQEAVSLLDIAINTISTVRSKLGAYQNRLEHSISNLDTTSENMTESLSRIEDVDMAEEMAAYTQKNVLAQAGTSMLAQANQRPQNILSLLQS
jgi:flagellin-like hook-associated protein FlgL